MTQTAQCDNCGAILGAEDQFCGECGAPRGETAEKAEPAAAQLSTSSEVTPPSGPLTDLSSPSSAPVDQPSVLPPLSGLPASLGEGRQVVGVVMIGLGVLACLGGLLGFLLLGSIGGETTTVQEDWLIAALCCLLPLGGAGILLAAVGGTIWYARQRHR